MSPKILDSALVFQRDINIISLYLVPFLCLDVDIVIDSCVFCELRLFIYSVIFVFCSNLCPGMVTVN